MQLVAKKAVIRSPAEQLSSYCNYTAPWTATPTGHLPSLCFAIASVGPRELSRMSPHVRRPRSQRSQKCDRVTDLDNWVGGVVSLDRDPAAIVEFGEAAEQPRQIGRAAAQFDLKRLSTR
jgi:hypothetical protein